MEKPVEISKLLTNERFILGHTEVKKRLEQLKADRSINEKQFEKIHNEDIFLKIKYKTYKKCFRLIIIGLIGIGFGLTNSSSLSYLFFIGGIILSISSFFGIISNRLTKNQKEYLKN